MKKFTENNFGSNKKYVKLQDACRIANIQVNGDYHNAVTDAEACYRLWMHMYPSYFNKPKRIS